MADSIYKVIELIGTSPKSWEDAAMSAVQTASKSLRDLRVAEITKMDLKIEKGKVVAFRTRVSTVSRPTISMLSKSGGLTI